MGLDRLRVHPPAQWPRAVQQNALLDVFLSNRMLSPDERLGSPEGFPHPWRVTRKRFEAPENGRATLNPDSTWRIDVAAGAINDVVASIPYRRVNDPRGWVMPLDYAGPKPGDSAFDAAWIDRDVLDDFADPPFLVARDPARGATTADDFTRITDAQRVRLEGGAFCSADDWQKELWASHVLLSASHFQPTYITTPLPPPVLKTFRLYVTKAVPGLNFEAELGGSIEIATLYLLRDPRDISGCTLSVRMRQWYPLWTVIVQPGQEAYQMIDHGTSVTGLGAGLGLGFADAFAQGLDASNQAAAQTAAGLIGDILQGTASVEFWDV